MTVREELEQGFQHLTDKQYRAAYDLFSRIWESNAGLIDRFVALKGLCNAMDGLGEWHKSETVWELRHEQWKKEVARAQRPQQQLQPARMTGGGWMLAIGAGLVGLALLKK